MKRKLVVIELKVRLQKWVPEDWDEAMINFHLNESSHCLGAEIGQLHRENTMADGCCTICYRCEARYLREAIEDDRENMPVPEQ